MSETEQWIQQQQQQQLLLKVDVHTRTHAQITVPVILHQVNRKHSVAAKFMKFLRKVEQTVGIGTPPGINGLIGITDNE